MKLPRYTATTPPPRETGLVRAQDIGALTNVGDAEFRAIQQAGGALKGAADTGFQALQHRQALDDQAFAGEADKRAFDAHKEGMGTYANFDPTIPNIDIRDAKNYYDGTKILNIDNKIKEEFLNATYKDYEAKIKNLAKGFKNPKTQQAFVNRWSVNGYTDFKEAGNAKHQAYQKELFLSNAKAAASNGDVETADLWIKIAEKHGLIGPKRAASERDKNIENYIVGLYRKGDYEEARKVLEASSLDSKQKESLDDEIDADQRAAKDKTVIAQEAYLNETHKLTMDTLSQDINDLSSIEKLPDDLKLYWNTKLGDRNKMIEAGKGDPFINVYDPARYNSFRTIMEQDPKNLKESQIIDVVGYGLTLDQGIDLIERHRKLSRKDSPLMAPEAKRSVKRITNAFEGGIIKHPDFIEDAVLGSEDEYKNSLLRDQIIDEHEEWLKEKPRTPEEIRKHTSEVLAPYEEMEGRNFLNQVFHNIFSREAWVFSAQDYRKAIISLNKEAQAEWEHIGIGERRHKYWGGVLPEDFIRKWQSPNKVLTPQIARIYKKWAHDDLETAKAMAQKDGWKEPK